MIFRKYLYLLLLTIHYSLFSVLILPSQSCAFLSQKKKVVVLARVGSKTVTREELLEAMKRRHMSARAGESLARQTSFERANFHKLLDELIDDKLMVLDAEEVELDKTEDFTSILDTYILNLSLERLRQDEILNKVKVKDRDIERYYKDKLNQDMPMELSAEKQGIKRIIYNEKVNEREREYRKYLKKKARIKIDRDVLDSLSLDRMDMVEDVVAHVNGEPILTVRFLQRWRSSGGSEEAKEEALESLIVRKLLDQQALKRRYYKKEEELQRRIQKKRESLLIESFKKKVISPLVKIKESEIKEYYEANKDRFKKPGSILAKLILVNSREKAEDILRELKAGADFSFLAEKRSLDYSAKKGGNVGWISLSNFSDEIRHIMLRAEKGEIVGPFSSKSDFTIWKILEKKKGSYKEIDEVRREIDMTIGRKKFKALLKEYLGKLRETVSIEVNEEELKRLEY